MAASSPVSAASTSASSGRESQRSGKSRLTRTAKPSSPSTSPTQSDMPTFNPSTGFWPTPVSNDDNKTVKAHLAMKRRMKGGPRKAITSLQVLVKGIAKGDVQLAFQQSMSSPV